MSLTYVYTHETLTTSKIMNMSTPPNPPPFPPAP